MTAININIAGDPLTREEKARIADRMSEAFAQVEVGNDSPMIRSGIMTHFEEVGTDNLWVGANPIAAPGPSNRSALISIRVMAGPWNANMKQDLIGRLNKILREEAGLVQSETGGHVWNTFVEVADGGWGVNGAGVTISQFGPLFADDRKKRISDYLARQGRGDP